MKAIMITITSLILLTVISAGSTKAGNPKDINKILKKEISYPEFAREQKLEGVVLVSFSLNSDGTIKVIMTNESDATLKDYVISKLKKLKMLPAKSDAGKTYDVKFEFKFEK